MRKEHCKNVVCSISDGLGTNNTLWTKTRGKKNRYDAQYLTTWPRDHTTNSEQLEQNDTLYQPSSLRSASRSIVAISRAGPAIGHCIAECLGTEGRAIPPAMATCSPSRYCCASFRLGHILSVFYLFLVRGSRDRVLEALETYTFIPRIHSKPFVTVCVRKTRAGSQRISRGIVRRFEICQGAI